MALQGPEELGQPVEESEDLDDQDASSISPAEEITLPAGPGSDDDADEDDDDDDDEPAGTTVLLPWDRFSAWLHCICVVGFDLELGQAVEVRKEVTPGRVPKVSSPSESETRFVDMETATASASILLATYRSYCRRVASKWNEVHMEDELSRLNTATLPTPA